MALHNLQHTGMRLMIIMIATMVNDVMIAMTMGDDDDDDDDCNGGR